MSESVARHNSRKGSLLEAGALVLLGGFVLWDAQSYPPALPGGAPGPAFFPRLVAGLLIVAAGWLAGRSFRLRTDRDTADSNPRAVVAAGTAVVAIAAYLLLLPVLGSLVALPLLAAALMALAGERSLVVLIAAPLVFAVAVQLLFASVLNVPLP